MRSNKNKWMSILAAICITAMMFAGCGEKGVENDLSTATPADSVETTTPAAESEAPQAPTGSTTTSNEPALTPTADTTQSTYTSGGGGGGSSTVVSTISSAVDSVTNTIGSNDQKIEYGTFQLLVSDRPADIEDFEHLNVTLSKARVFKAGGFRYGYGYGSEEGASGYNITNLDNITVDLTKLVGAKSLPISETELPAGKYTKVELYVEDVEAKLNDTGESATVIVPPGKLMITKNFDIVPGENTTFVFDINVVKKGHRDEYNLHPVISESGEVGKHLKHSEVEVVDN